MHPDWQEETKHLAEIMTFLRDHKDDVYRRKVEADRTVDSARKNLGADDGDLYSVLDVGLMNQEYLSRKVKEMENAFDRPYFARVDFTPDDTRTPDKLYIGKMTLIDDADQRLLITDWRAPVATLYYEGRIGAAAYDCHEGHITGEISLKRQYTIEHAELKTIMDIDITTNDEFLQAALGSSKDRRLKDIVTTIQAEQNRVIRADLSRPMIVQGAAGSGKTTIALHRVAWLLYTYEKQIFAHQFLIMAPNRFFLSYISDVLPDLGVESVSQTTFEDFAQQYIGKKLKLAKPSEVIAEAVNSGDYHNARIRAAHLKSGLAYRGLIERYIGVILRDMIPKSDFVIENFPVLEQAEIARLLTEEYKYLPFEGRVRELRKNLSNALKRRKTWIIDWLNQTYDDKKTDIKLAMPDCPERRVTITRLLDERDSRIKTVTSKSSSALKKYLAQIQIQDPLKYYLMLFHNERMFRHLGKDIFAEDELDLIWEETRRALDDKRLEPEDIPPIMLLQLKLLLSKDGLDTRHIVIDEAQDYSLFQFSILKDIVKSQSFSILGDVNQGIYSYHGIENWEDLEENIFDHRPQMFSMEQSYRTTVEIMDCANSVIARLGKRGVPLAKPVIRHGEAVSVYVLADMATIAAAIDEDIKRIVADGFHSIAIICKTEAECHEFGQMLNSHPVMITGGETEYPGGLLLLPSYLTKGLEFDAVIIANATPGNYTADPLDIKLLYIAMTRALHRLKIYAVNEVTKLIRNVNVQEN